MQEGQWAELVSTEDGMDQELQHFHVDKNALVVVDAKSVQLHLDHESGSDEEDANRQIKEKMLEIAQILNIAMEDRILEFRVHLGDDRPR